MFSIHFNGDIIRHPDIKAIKTRIAEKYDAEQRCKYGVQKHYCSAFLNFWRESTPVEKLKKDFICPLAGCSMCPQHKVRKRTGEMEKTFKIDHLTYRKISSGAHYLAKECEHKILFLTLTFPEFKKPEYENDEQKLNAAFVRFRDNLHNNYGVKNYIAVRERGGKNNRYHFHLLCDIKFVDLRRINSAWCYSIRDICKSSKNAIQTDKKCRIIGNPTRALRYICKYFSKAINTRSRSRVVFLSRSLILKPVRERLHLSYFLKNYDFRFRITSPYTTHFRIDNYKQFKKFCEEYLYPAFEISIKQKKPVFVGAGSNFDTS